MVIITPVNTKRVIAFEVFHDCKNMYHRIHIIAALTTGAPSQTNTEKATILKLTIMTLKAGGRNQNIKVINIMSKSRIIKVFF